VCSGDALNDDEQLRLADVLALMQRVLELHQLYSDPRSSPMGMTFTDDDVKELREQHREDRLELERELLKWERRDAARLYRLVLGPPTQRSMMQRARAAVSRESGASAAWGRLPAEERSLRPKPGVFASLLAKGGYIESEHELWEHATSWCGRACRGSEALDSFVAALDTLAQRGLITGVGRSRVSEALPRTANRKRGANHAVLLLSRLTGVAKNTIETHCELAASAGTTLAHREAMDAKFALGPGRQRRHAVAASSAAPELRSKDVTRRSGEPRALKRSKEGARGPADRIRKSRA
jgi:hypothetical protein